MKFRVWQWLVEKIDTLKLKNIIFIICFVRSGFDYEFPFISAFSDGFINLYYSDSVANEVLFDYFYTAFK